MQTKFYYTTNNKSQRLVESYLKEHGVEYTKQTIVSEPLTWEQFLEILMYTENGVEEVLSVRSSAFKMLRTKINFSELTVREFYDLVSEFPTLLRSPIVVGNKTTTVGYIKEELGAYLPKEKRREIRNNVLKAARTMDGNTHSEAI